MSNEHLLATLSYFLSPFTLPFSRWLNSFHPCFSLQANDLAIYLTEKIEAIIRGFFYTTSVSQSYLFEIFCLCFYYFGWSVLNCNQPCNLCTSIIIFIVIIIIFLLWAPFYIIIFLLSTESFLLANNMLCLQSPPLKKKKKLSLSSISPSSCFPISLLP